jgi:hypothetical protein
MALTYGQVLALTGNQTYLGQVTTAIVKQALSRITATAPAPTAAEVAFCAAIIRSPASYATRFLLDALIVFGPSLTSTNGSTVDSAPSDATFDTAILGQWAAQVAAGA